MWSNQKWEIPCIWAHSAQRSGSNKSDLAVNQQTVRCAPRWLCCRGERKYQRQQCGSFRSAVHRFLTHNSNRRHSCWQQISTSWWNETSGGVGHRVEQRDAVSSSTARAWGEKRNMAGRDDKLGRVRNGALQGQRNGRSWCQWGQRQHCPPWESCLKEMSSRDTQELAAICWTWPCRNMNARSHKCTSMGTVEHKHAGAEANNLCYITTLSKTSKNRFHSLADRSWCVL